MNVQQTMQDILNGKLSLTKLMEGEEWETMDPEQCTGECRYLCGIITDNQAIIEEWFMDTNTDFKLLDYMDQLNTEWTTENYEPLLQKDGSHITEKQFRIILGLCNEDHFDQLVKLYDAISYSGIFHKHLLENGRYDLYLGLSKIYNFYPYFNETSEEPDYLSKLNQIRTNEDINIEVLMKWITDEKMIKSIEQSKQCAYIISLLMANYDNMNIEEKVVFQKLLVNVTRVGELRTTSILSHITDPFFIELVKDAPIHDDKIFFRFLVKKGNINFIKSKYSPLSDIFLMHIIIRGDKVIIDEFFDGFRQDTIDDLAEKLNSS